MPDKVPTTFQEMLEVPAYVRALELVGQRCPVGEIARALATEFEMDGREAGWIAHHCAYAVGARLREKAIYWIIGSLGCLVLLPFVLFLLYAIGSLLALVEPRAENDSLGKVTWIRNSAVSSALMMVGLVKLWRANAMMPLGIKSARRRAVEEALTWFAGAIVWFILSMSGANSLSVSESGAVGPESSTWIGVFGGTGLMLIVGMMKLARASRIEPPREQTPRPVIDPSSKYDY